METRGLTIPHVARPQRPPSVGPLHSVPRQGHGPTGGISGLTHFLRLRTYFTQLFLHLNSNLQKLFLQPGGLKYEMHEVFPSDVTALA